MNASILFIVLWCVPLCAQEEQCETLVELGDTSKKLFENEDDLFDVEIEEYEDLGGPLEGGVQLVGPESSGEDSTNSSGISGKDPAEEEREEGEEEDEGIESLAKLLGPSTTSLASDNRSDKIADLEKFIRAFMEKLKYPIIEELTKNRPLSELLHEMMKEKHEVFKASDYLFQVKACPSPASKKELLRALTKRKEEARKKLVESDVPMLNRRELLERLIDGPRWFEGTEVTFVQSPSVKKVKKAIKENPNALLSVSKIKKKLAKLHRQEKLSKEERQEMEKCQKLLSEGKKTHFENLYQMAVKKFEKDPQKPHLYPDVSEYVRDSSKKLEINMPLLARIVFKIPFGSPLGARDPQLLLAQAPAERKQKLEVIDAAEFTRKKTNFDEDRYRKKTGDDEKELFDEVGLEIEDSITQSEIDEKEEKRAEREQVEKAEKEHLATLSEEQKKAFLADKQKKEEAKKREEMERERQKIIDLPDQFNGTANISVLEKNRDKIFVTSDIFKKRKLTQLIVKEAKDKDGKLYNSVVFHLMDHFIDEVRGIEEKNENLDNAHCLLMVSDGQRADEIFEEIGKQYREDNRIFQQLDSIREFVESI